MKKYQLAISLILTATLCACYNPFKNPFGGGDDDSGGSDSREERPSAQPARVIEPTGKFSLAIGGVAPGRDELVIYNQYGEIQNFDGRTLDCTADSSIVATRPRPGYTTVAEGSGVQIVATSPGVAAIRCSVDNEELSQVYEVTIPPQSLIQILIAEAAEQITYEAKLDENLEDDSVLLTSQSPTANALGSVIRNRISFINTGEDTALFEVDVDDYDYDPPASYYNAVIMAKGQFSPTDPENEMYRTFDNAQDRNFLDKEWLVAYDQAVLAAAGIFNGDIEDPTTGAFAFYSPTQDEWDYVARAWTLHHTEIPEEAGFTDADFPAFAPIQLLILDSNDIWEYDDSRPAFIYARMRTSEDPAVVKVWYEMDNQ